MGGDKIFVSKPMFFWMKNPMITLKKSIWLLVNAEFKLAVFEINRNYINWSMGPMDPHAPARNVWNLSYFVTGTYPNMKRGCHHHQIGMDYLYDTILKIANSEVKLHFRL